MHSPADILVTGAGGYIGGSIVADFSKGKGDLESKVRLHTVVRSKEQADSLKHLDVDVLQVDLSDADTISRYIFEQKIDLVIHTATSIDSAAALNIINALDKRKAESGKKVYFIHTSGLSAFDENTGWPFGEVKDSDPVLDMERRSASSYIVREVDVLLGEQAAAHEVTFFNVMPPNIHGRGSGPWDQLSPQLPGLVRASIAARKVHKFPENRTCPFVHIFDLTSFYATLVTAILQGKSIPSGESGYYLPMSHRVSWWDILDEMARALCTRDLVDDENVEPWKNDNEAAEALGVPPKFAHSIFNSGPEIVSENPPKIGWVPTWNAERMLQSLGDEINDVLELGEAKSSLLGSVNPRSK